MVLSFPGDTAPVHDYLVTANVVTAERVNVAHGDRVPWDIVDPAGTLVDEMVMGFDLRIEHDLALGEDELAQQALASEQMQRVVGGSPRQQREAAAHHGPDPIGRRVLAGAEHVLGDGRPLQRRPNVVATEQLQNLIHS
jgi:hypothetical protein